MWYLSAFDRIIIEDDMYRSELMLIIYNQTFISFTYYDTYCLSWLPRTWTILSLDKMLDILKTVCSMVYHHYNLFNKALFGVFYSWGPFYWHGLISAWISNHMPSEVWDEITYPFPNLNGCTFEVWKWISNFIPHNVMHVFTYPCWDLSLSMLEKGPPGGLTD